MTATIDPPGSRSDKMTGPDCAGGPVPFRSGVSAFGWRWSHSGSSWVGCPRGELQEQLPIGGTIWSREPPTPVDTGRRWFDNVGELHLNPACSQLVSRAHEECGPGLPLELATAAPAR